MQKVFAFICFCLPMIGLSQTKVELSINPSSVEVGETFQIIVSSNVYGTIDLDKLPDEFVQDIGITEESGQFTDANGKTTVVYSKIYTGRINKSGRFSFGPAYFTRSGKTNTSNSASITINPKVKMNSSSVSTQAFRNPAFGVIQVNKTRIYEGEPLLVRAKMYARYNPTHLKNYAEYQLPVTMTKYPIGPPNVFKTNREQFRGEDFTTVEYDKQVVFPTGSGNFTIEPFQVHLCQGYQSFLVTSKEFDVTIVPLPAYPPSDFIGAVGDFSVKRSLSKTKIKQGEIIQMIVTVSGLGNLHNITQPVLNLPPEFEVYGDPTISEHYTIGAHGAEGYISYEYNIEVTDFGTLYLPETSISFFDPNREVYVKEATESDSLSVTESKTYAADLKKSNDNSRLEELVIQEFNPREDSGSYEPGALFGSKIFWGGISVPLASAFLFLLFVKSREHSEEKAAIRKAKNQRSAYFSNALNEVRLASTQSDSAAFFIKLESALRTAITADMEIQEGMVLGKEELLKHMSSYGSDARQHVAELFEACEHAKYGFGADGAAKEDLMIDLEEIVKQLKNIR